MNSVCVDVLCSVEDGMRLSFPGKLPNWYNADPGGRINLIEKPEIVRGFEDAR